MLTVCERVCQFCQPPVLGTVQLPSTMEPPFRSAETAPPFGLATRNRIV